MEVSGIQQQLDAEKSELKSDKMHLAKHAAELKQHVPCVAGGNIRRVALSEGLARKNVARHDVIQEEYSTDEDKDDQAKQPAVDPVHQNLPPSKSDACEDQPQTGASSDRKKKRKIPLLLKDCHDLKSLSEAEKFAEVFSRLSPTTSNRKRQKTHIVSGAELIRRCQGPENLKTTLVAQMLRIGKGTEEFKHLSSTLKKLFPESRVKETNLSSFTVLTEGEVREMANELRQLAAVHLPTATIARERWSSLNTSTAHKMAALQTTIDQIQWLEDKFLLNCETFNTCTHGGKYIFITVFDFIKDVLNSAIAQ